jgi:hypothetical protein
LLGLLQAGAAAGCGDGSDAGKADHSVDAQASGDAGSDGRGDVMAEVRAGDLREDAPADAPGPIDAAASHATWPVPDPGATSGVTAQRYQIGTDVVQDLVTGLTWQRSSAPPQTWQAAGATCAALVLNGRDDWRLPSRIELVSLVDFTRHTPTINPEAFPNTPSQWFWTASTLADIPGFAWYVYFETGFSNYIDQDFEYHVRCVRGPATAWAGYVLTEESVTDGGTGLEWQRKIDEVERTRAEATALCAARPGGWRLPTMKELQTIVDDSRADPAIDVVAFPDTPSESFWTATPFAPIPGSAWRTSFQRGYTYDSMEDSTYRVRCVRSVR